MTTRVGIGVDAHPFKEGRRLVLAGITIPWPMGLDGHSDGDVLTHAAIDAILGGSGLGDIGTHFPSTDRQYINASGAELMTETIRIVTQSGWRTQYLDATIIAQTPNFASHILQMRKNVSAVVKLEKDRINIKATTTDHLGFIGKEKETLDQ